MGTIPARHLDLDDVSMASGIALFMSSYGEITCTIHARHLDLDDVSMASGIALLCMHRVKSCLPCHGLQVYWIKYNISLLNGDHF